MRTYNALTARLAALMGTVPTTVQVTEVPQAFATGIIDVLFTSGQTGITNRAWEYTKYFYDTGSWLPRNTVFANEAAFRKLSPDVQKAVLEAADIAEARGWKMSQEQNVEAPKVLQKNGIQVLQPTPQLHDELRKIGSIMLSDWLERAKDDGKKVIAEYRKRVPQ
jgi:TRAP-type C4-dicarboxylate transport system substrate-binding protein